MLLYGCLLPKSVIHMCFWKTFVWNKDIFGTRFQKMSQTCLKTSHGPGIRRLRFLQEHLAQDGEISVCLLNYPRACHARQKDRRRFQLVLTWCLWQSITTITWVVVGRIKAVNIKCSTVSHADVFWMIAAIIEKLWHTLRKTDFSFHNSLGHCWMSAIEPAGRVCAAGIHLWTRLCHLCSSPSTKSIPTRQFGIGEVTKASACIRHCSVRLVEKYVVGTFYKKFEILQLDFMPVYSFLNNVRQHHLK